MTPDGRLVFCNRIPKLQDMAAFKAALDLWVYYIKCELSGRINVVLNCERVAESYRTREAEIRRMAENLKLPKVIEGSIKKFVTSICVQVLSLAVYFQDFMLFVRMTKEHLCDAVWQPDGTINYEKIICKIIKSNEMNERQRFALMCEYCIEEEIQNTWRTLKDRSFIDGAQLHRNRMIVYWDCVMKGDFSKMEVDNIADADKCILRGFRSHNLRTVEYFFNRLNDDERIEYGIEQMKNGGARMAKFLIPKYSKEEQYRLLNTSNFYIKLIMIFAVSDINYALQTWIHVKHLVEGVQFVRILLQVGCERLHHNDVHELLVEIWRSSPKHLKQYVYSIFPSNKTLSWNKNFLYGLCIDPFYVSIFDKSRPQRDDSILIEVLLDADPKYRKEVWRCYWAEIVVLSRPSYLRNIMKLCLSADDLEELKSNIMCCDVVLRYFIDLITYGRFSDLDEFLHMFVGGEQREVNIMKRQLLQSASNIASIVQNCDQTVSSVAVLREFLIEVFENDENLLAEFEEKMIVEAFRPTAPYSLYQLVRIFTVSERLCEKQTLVKVKDKLLQKCKSVALDNSYRYYATKPEMWSMLLMWCLGSEQKAAEFQDLL